MAPRKNVSKSYKSSDATAAARSSQSAEASRRRTRTTASSRSGTTHPRVLATPSPPHHRAVSHVSPTSHLNSPSFSLSALSDKENQPSRVLADPQSVLAPLDRNDTSSSHIERPMHSTPIAGVSSTSLRAKAPRESRILRSLKVMPSGDVAYEDGLEEKGLREGIFDAVPGQPLAYLDKHFGNQSVDGEESRLYDSPLQRPDDRRASEKAMPWLSAVEKERWNDASNSEHDEAGEGSVPVSDEEDDPFGFNAAWRDMEGEKDAAKKTTPMEGAEILSSNHLKCPDTGPNSPDLHPNRSRAAKLADGSLPRSESSQSGASGSSRQLNLIVAVPARRQPRRTVSKSVSSSASSQPFAVNTPSKQSGSDSIQEPPSPSAVLADVAEPSIRGRAHAAQTKMSGAAKRRAIAIPSKPLSSSKAVKKRMTLPMKRPTRVAAARSTKEHKHNDKVVDDADSLSSSEDLPLSASTRKRGQPLANKNAKSSVVTRSSKAGRVRRKKGGSIDEEAKVQGKAGKGALSMGGGNAKKRGAQPTDSEDEVQEIKIPSDSSSVRHDREKRLKAYQELDDFELEEEQVW